MVNKFIIHFCLGKIEKINFENKTESIKLINKWAEQ